MSEEELRIKYMDDLSLAEVINLKDLTEADQLIGPRLFHDRNGLKLPPDKSKVQERLNELEQYVTVHDMKLNTTKTKIIPFNFTRKHDYISWRPKLRSCLHNQAAWCDMYSRLQVEREHKNIW